MWREVFHQKKVPGSVVTSSYHICVSVACACSPAFALPSPKVRRQLEQPRYQVSHPRRRTHKLNMPVQSTASAGSKSTSGANSSCSHSNGAAAGPVLAAGCCRSERSRDAFSPAEVRLRQRERRQCEAQTCPVQVND